MKLKELFSNIDTYVMCSTLNQIVNYIPLKLLEVYNEKNESLDIFNITLKNDTIRFYNNEWNENLADVLDKQGKSYNVNPIYISKDRLNFSFISESKEDGTSDLNGCVIKKQPQGKVLWNITGGQRSTIVTIQEYIRKNERFDDYIIYLEGNSNKIVYGKLYSEKGQIGFEYKLINENYKCEDINIETVLELAGFSSSPNIVKLNVNSDKNEDEIFWINLFNKLKDEDFKLEMINLNKTKKYYDSKEIEKEDDYKKLKTNKQKNEDKRQIEYKRERRKQELKKYMLKRKLNSFLDGKDIDKLVNDFGINMNFFGHIFEYIMAYEIKRQIQGNNMSDYFKEITISHKINHRNKIENKKEKADEIDILLLSQSGQLIVFECKSGTAEREFAKSHKYTNYSIAGVYGVPILITPLSKDQILRKDKLQDDYKNIISSVNAAGRANLKIWGIDEIGQRLEQLYWESIC